MPDKKPAAIPDKKPNRYSAIIGTIFKRYYKPGKTQFEFSRDEFLGVAKSLGIALPKNLGDAIYSFRFRTALPSEIVGTAPKGMEWGIELAGKGVYRFRLGTLIRIVPRPGLVTIKIPDATPEIIASYALSDEQALLAKVRYNRLIDIFLGIATYSLQNHLRTTVAGIGQSRWTRSTSGSIGTDSSSSSPFRRRVGATNWARPRPARMWHVASRSFRDSRAGQFRPSSWPMTRSHYSS